MSTMNELLTDLMSTNEDKLWLGVYARFLRDAGEGGKTPEYASKRLLDAAKYLESAIEDLTPTEKETQ